MTEIASDRCTDLATASSLEWLETNGIGGYATSTISGINTRRYHGLLVASTRPPLGRLLLLSKLEETVLVGGERFELSANRYPDAVHPEGYRYITSFRLDPFPAWTFIVGGVEIEKRLFMPHGMNTVAVRWKCSSPDGFSLEVRPLLAFRDHHHLQHADPRFATGYDHEPGRLTFTPYPEMPSLFLTGNFQTVDHRGEWYRNFEYGIEKERGFDFLEDLYQPCVLSFDLDDTQEIVASTESTKLDVSDLHDREIKRRAMLVAQSHAKIPSLQTVVLAGDQFIVDRGAGKTVIAGYPWFSDWGRDTMIALPGLTLSTKRPQIAKSIILEFSRHISEGMIPNRFPDEGETPEYNTVDATLWYFEAIRAYAAETGDHTFVREHLYEKLTEIIAWHERGTRYGIRLDDDGLLIAGEPGTQLTWMDAKVGDRVITPRIGKPVEIQALWYNALLTMAEFAEAFYDDVRAVHYGALAARARFSFEPTFWNETDQCLFDVSFLGNKDRSIRPNQIFAVSLHHAIAQGDMARLIVDRVRSELLTPFGLCSLSPKDPNYIGTYIGSPEERDSAYHQGTVWGWLIGPFIDAYRKTRRADREAQLSIEKMLSPLQEHICNSGMLGQVSEIFDGDPPHTPRGCPAQAWSVAELLRVLGRQTVSFQ